MKYTATFFTPIYRRGCYILSLLAILMFSTMYNNARAQCPPIVINSSNSYYQGFEGITTAGTLPSCNFATTGVGTVITQTPSQSVPHSGNDFLSMPYGYPFSPYFYGVPPLTLTAGQTYNFSFWYKTPGSSTFTIFVTLDTLTISGSSVIATTLDTPLYLTNVLNNGTYALASCSFVCPSWASGHTFGVLINEFNPSYTANVFIDDVNLSQATANVGKPSLNIVGPTSVCPAGSGNNGNGALNLFDSVNLNTTGITYQWQSSPAGTNAFVNISGATSNVLNTVFTASTDYRLIATDTLTHLKDTSAIHTVTVNPFYNCYCNPYLNANYSNSSNNLGGGGIAPLIDSVSLVNTTLNNQTFVSLSNAYQFYPPMTNTTTTLYRGSTYTISALMNVLGAAPEVWIDYNHNSSFDAGEYIGMTASFLSFMATGNFTVPSTAQLGTTGLRIRSGGSGGSGDACVDLSTGETEDYLVNIAPAPLNDLSVTQVVQPSLSSQVCANSTFTVSAQVTNTGSLSQSNFLVGATYPGNSTPIYAYYNGTLAPGATVNFNIGTISIPTGGTYNIKAYTALPNDQNIANDTAYSYVVVDGLPPDPITISDTVCTGYNATISVNAVSGNTYNWYNAPSGGSVIYTGTQQTLLGITNNTTFYVAASTPGVTGSMNVGTTGVPNGGCNGGVMFNVSPNTNLTIDSFALNFSDVGLQPVSIYYRLGNFQGNQDNIGAWAFLGSTAINVTNTSLTYTATVNNPLNLTVGNSYAIYISYDGQNTLTPATGATYSGADMTVSVPSITTNPTANAAELCGFFGSQNVANQYILDGTIYYHLGGSACQSNRVPVTAAVGSAPVVNLGPNDTVCYSPTLYLDAGNPGATYMWNTGDTTQRIQLHDSGTYTYSVVVTKYCTADTAYKTVDVLPLPRVLGISYVQSNGVTYAFSASGVQYVTGYYWNFGDNTGSNQAAPTHTYSNTYPHHVMLIVSNDCGADTLHWDVPTTGVTNVNSTKGDISVYPNPANTKITVNALENLELKDLAIINAIGQEVYYIPSTNGKAENIDISKLPAGNYIIRANTTDGIYNKVFQVVRQ